MQQLYLELKPCIRLLSESADQTQTHQCVINQQPLISDLCMIGWQRISGNHSRDQRPDATLDGSKVSLNKRGHMWWNGTHHTLL